MLFNILADAHRGEEPRDENYEQGYGYGADPGQAPDDQGPLLDAPDSRDFCFAFNAERPLGRHVDLRDRCPPVYNQQAMMSCTAHAVAGAFEFGVLKQGLPPFSPSRLFIWYHSREKSSVPYAVQKNVGASLRITVQTLARGVCSEKDWSYEVSEYNKKTFVFVRGAKAARKPPTTAEVHAHQHTATRYFSFSNAASQLDLQKRLIQCLDQGYPFIFGMKTYGLMSSGRINSNGEGLRMPTAKEQKGDQHRHSLLAVGYIQERKVFIVRNSWGVSFGEDGYFYMPYAYLKHCYDYWTIRIVTDGSKRPPAKPKGRK